MVLDHRDRGHVRFGGKGRGSRILFEKRRLATVAEGDIAATSLASVHGGVGNAKCTADKGRRGAVALQRGSGIHLFVDTVLLSPGEAVYRSINTSRRQRAGLTIGS